MAQSKPLYFFYAVAFIIFAALLVLTELARTKIALEANFAAPLVRTARHG